MTTDGFILAIIRSIAGVVTTGFFTCIITIIFHLGIATDLHFGRPMIQLSKLCLEGFCRIISGFR
ncbi:hypothetical protein C451_05343 [Halococcus thailandensis JCM 13552]|uniref:Uncharacterized protein n=1 Tax=Halococcus thailandensis JCM 13552 TaxID=1227457 RepID=M0NBX3_9EURY|nr:hypothetical protein C451_05343 [Halococcus thailandensis JCM 13552]